jgi:hypothetical protein
LVLAQRATNVPASHGQWGGYRTTKALAWLINLAPNAWLAPEGLSCCGIFVTYLSA